MFIARHESENSSPSSKVICRMNNTSSCDVNPFPYKRRWKLTETFKFCVLNMRGEVKFAVFRGV
jgi:hypothetical protein